MRNLLSILTSSEAIMEDLNSPRLLVWLVTSWYWSRPTTEAWVCTDVILSAMQTCGHLNAQGQLCASSGANQLRQHSTRSHLPRLPYRVAQSWDHTHSSFHNIQHGKCLTGDTLHLMIHDESRTVVMILSQKTGRGFYTLPHTSITSDLMVQGETRERRYGLKRQSFVTLAVSSWFNRLISRGGHKCCFWSSWWELHMSIGDAMRCPSHLIACVVRRWF